MRTLIKASAPAKKKPRTSRTGAQGGRKFRSVEYEGIIRKVLGGHLFCARHHCEGVDLNRRRGGNTGLRIGYCPSCDAGHDQSGGANCEQIGRVALWRTSQRLGAKLNDCTLSEREARRKCSRIVPAGLVPNPDA